MTDEYRRLLAHMHQTNPGFGTSAVRHWSADVQAFVQTMDSTDVLDYGCGKSDFAPVLGFGIQRYDPAMIGLDTEPDPAWLVLCIDVLEHIEPDCLENVLEDVREKTLFAAFMVISNRKAGHVLPDGRNAHLIVKNRDWWEGKLRVYFESLHVVKEKPGDHFACIAYAGG